MSTQVKDRVSRLAVRQSRVSNMPLGLTPRELVAAALAIAFFLSVIIYYFTSVKPERERLKVLEATMEAQQQVIRASIAGLKPTDASSDINAPTEALNSLQVFKSQYLKPLNKGRIDLLNEINGLAKKNSAQLTSGIEMSLQSVDAEDESKPSKKKSSTNKAEMNVFPRLAIHFEVAGSYSSLRALIAELEKSKQFIVLDSINLTSIDASGEEGGPRGAGGSGINLSINMTAYFQP
ncbi:MAG TPA: GspMb/PilO family protein [Blastocatellia bacterium]|nr:GspMb/PilO family protein [Blastocatellia bacterium]